MPEAADSEVVRLPPQPPISPPTVPAAPPSLGLYAVLIITSSALIAVAFTFGRADWPGLLVSLATNLIAAVIVLLAIERRLRPNDAAALAALGRTTIERLSLLPFRDARVLTLYGLTLRNRIDLTTRPFKFDRRATELELLQKSRQGVILSGLAGTGKTTILRGAALRAADQLLRRPLRAPVPVFIQLRTLGSDELRLAIERSINSFAVVPAGVIDRVIRNGRLLCLLDGLDEAPQPEVTAAHIAEFHAAIPRVALIIATRSLVGDNSAKQLKMNHLVAPELTVAERERVIRWWQEAQARAT
jgi:NACHT domain-containing protein